MMAHSVVAVLVIVILLSLLFILCGRKVLNNLKPFDSSPLFINGFSYFFGMSLFLTSFRFLCYIISNAKVSLIISLITICLLSLLFLKDISYKEISKLLGYKESFLSIIFACCVFAFVLANHLTPFTKTFLVYDDIGSLHSGRYANIATFILESNRIPIINQNYGQSILASVPMILGCNKPLLALYIWLSISMIGLAAVFYGFFRLLGMNSKISAFGTFVLLLGSTSMSFVHVLVIDSGSPWLFNGHTDCLASIATFLGFLVWSIHNYFPSFNYSFNKKNLSKTILVPFILGFVWNINAPQNIVIFLMIIFIILLWTIVRGRAYLKNNFFLSCIFISGVLLGAIQGGMLAPKSMLENVSIKGVENLQGDEPIISLSPLLPHHYPSWEKTWQYAYANNSLNKESLAKFLRAKTINGLHGLIWGFESNLWSSLRVSFFPILGLIGLGFSIYFRREDICETGGPYIFESSYFSFFRKLWLLSFITFVVGFNIAFWIKFKGHKWPLTRFLIPGYTLGMMLFVVLINNTIIVVKKTCVKYIFLLLITIFITIGPISYGTQVMYDNKTGTSSAWLNHRGTSSSLRLNSRGVPSSIPFYERVKILISFSGMI